jgi:hypothetical protein
VRPTKLWAAALLRSADNGHASCRDYSRSTSQARTLGQLNECFSSINTYCTLNSSSVVVIESPRYLQEVQHLVPTDRSPTPLEGFTWKKRGVIIANQATQCLDKPPCSSCQSILKLLLPLLNVAVCSVCGRTWQHCTFLCLGATHK